MEGGEGGEQQQARKGGGEVVGEKGEGVVSRGVGGGGGRQKLSPHSHNLPCGPRRVRVVFFAYYIYHHKFKIEYP